ncbi:hypothetical protein PIB30_068283 [Stylosanthes scabra]|uniref:Uncharacterized protein n=1 Tax=Stylosanthes scabra TaxID=79078 RepID=A0ABU6SN96_9FABA|nr:hypothetical protein [Stylosanthes scabra]
MSSLLPHKTINVSITFFPKCEPPNVSSLYPTITPNMSSLHHNQPQTKQVKLQEHSHEIPFEEALEEEFEDKTGDNMAGNEDKGKSVDPGKSPHIPTTSYTPHPSVLVGSASKASSKDVSNHFFDPP